MPLFLTNAWLTPKEYAVALANLFYEIDDDMIDLDMGIEEQSVSSREVTSYKDDANVCRIFLELSRS